MRRPLTLAALVLVPLALYARVVTFDYVQADDTDLIRGNISFLQNLRNIPDTFARSYFEVEGQPSGRKSYYRPLVIVSFMVDAQVRGADPRVYHLTNVLIHIAGVVLLFALLKRLGSEEVPALVLALLFAVHPANVQAVAWIPGRNDTLMAALSVISMIAFHHYCFAVATPKLEERRRVAVARRADSSVNPESQRRTSGPWWLVLHAAAYAAALFTKESALALPLVLALLAKARPERAKRVEGRLAPAFLADAVVVAVWFVMRRAVLMDGGDAPDAQALLAAFVGNARDLLLYAGKLILPAHLSVMPGLTRVDVALGAISLALLGWLLARLAPRWRWVIIAWILLFVIPALLIPGLPAYEHRLYFPLMAVIVGISRLPAWSTDPRRWIGIAATVGAVFATLSFVHTDVFRDRYTYWQSATTGTPYAGLAHVNLGQIAESDGDSTRAAEHYRAALAADPSTPGAHNNLGILAARRGDADEARAEFHREVERHPGNADAYYNLGLVEKFSNRFDEAAPWWERAVAVDPRHTAAHEELAAYFEAKGDVQRAARHRDAAAPR
jgi:tetratricopeptide (TPR) repeat protein